MIRNRIAAAKTDLIINKAFGGKAMQVELNKNKKTDYSILR